DDQVITQGPGPVKQVHVARVQDVEATTGGHNAFSPAPGPLRGGWADQGVDGRFLDTTRFRVRRGRAVGDKTRRRARTQVHRLGGVRPSSQNRGAGGRERVTGPTRDTRLGHRGGPAPPGLSPAVVPGGTVFPQGDGDGADPPQLRESASPTGTTALLLTDPGLVLVRGDHSGSRDR